MGLRLQAYLDGEIDEGRIRLISQHLEECRRCGMEATTYAAIKEALSRMASPPARQALERLRGFAEALAEAEATEPGALDA